ncbi:MAG: hypothetical protein WKG00_05160 [Polyangiaceae bacterium]
MGSGVVGRLSAFQLPPLRKTLRICRRCDRGQLLCDAWRPAQRAESLRRAAVAYARGLTIAAVPELRGSRARDCHWMMVVDDLDAAGTRSAADTSTPRSSQHACAE